MQKLFSGWFLRLLALFAGVWLSISEFMLLRGVEVHIPVQQQNPVFEDRASSAGALAAVDGLGRVLPMEAEAGGERKDRFVGLFYWTWHVSQAKNVRQVVNVNNVVANAPTAVHDLNHPAWGYFGMPHHWDEPLYGYYDTDDRWVLRRHAELLAAAGVDVIIFDNTNGTATWKDSYDVLFEVFAEARADGVKTPQIAFLLPLFGADDNTDTQLRMLYTDIYKPGRYSDLWFYWKGKPLIMAYPDHMRRSKDPLDKEIYAFFSFRPGVAGYNESGEDKKGKTALSRAFSENLYWNWLSVYPQAVNYNRDGTPEQMTVGVAQNWSAERGLTAMNGENVFGRTYTSKGYDTRENAVLYGANFAEQAAYALEVDPEFVFITGWNEWVAGRFEEWCGVTNAFPDEYNDAFSRDMEPSAGKLKDHYYYQMADFIRRYKGVKPTAADTVRRTIGSFADWENVPVTYWSYENNTFNRDDVGYGNIRYTDATGRNDIAWAKAASDNENLYFLVACKNELTPRTDPQWMRLLLSTGGSSAWEGYDFIVNRTGAGSLERSSGGWNWETVGAANVQVNGNLLWITIPKSALGLTGNAFTVDFKWTDNTLENGDIMDLYLHGDTAPVGRFNFRYVSGG